jgi:ribosomal protein S18 acetylase RimI-like enzyme
MTADAIDPSEVRVRSAVPGDARAVAKVHVAGWSWGYRGLLPNDVIAARTVEDREAQWIVGFAVERSDGGGGLVAEDRSGRIVGFVAFGPASEEEMAPPPGWGEVYALYLSEDAAGRGVGRRLLDAAVASLRSNGFEHAVLWVLDANVRARRFYERAGWRVDGARGSHRFDCDDRPIVRYATDL